MKSAITLLKLGGSLITNKEKAASALHERIMGLACEIASVHAKQSDMQLISGHGSGSFGHFPAKKYGTRDGVFSKSDWDGFAEVWTQAMKLNQIVMKALQEAGLEVVTFPPSATLTTKKGAIENWDLTPIQKALEENIIPVIFGDVTFDVEIGGSIVSTEDLFLYLTKELNVDMVLLAANEQVYADYPVRKEGVEKISSQSFEALAPKLSIGEGSDVTGGMYSKVKIALEMAAVNPETEIRIFSATEARNLQGALEGRAAGTLISND
jgi:isopentenyl phosphate kinase